MCSYLISLVFVFSITFCIFCDMSYASPFPCKQCESEEECNSPPTDFCMWGESQDSCGRRVCSKGPGERCGGPRHVLGHCGEGMMCKATGRCHGCSIQTMTCFND